MVQPTYKQFQATNVPEPDIMTGRWAPVWDACKKLPLNSPKFEVFEFSDPKDANRAQTALNSYQRRYHTSDEKWRLRLSLRRGNMLYVKRIPI